MLNRSTFNYTCVMGAFFISNHGSESFIFLMTNTADHGNKTTNLTQAFLGLTCGAKQTHSGLCEQHIPTS